MRFRDKNGGNNNGITAVFSDISIALFHFFKFPIDIVNILQFCQSIYIDNRALTHYCSQGIVAHHWFL